MTRGWVVLAGWGGVLVAFTAVQLAFAPNAIELALLGGTGAGMVALGLAALAGERRGLPPRPESGVPAPVPWTSAASATVGVGIGVLVLGWEAGAWLMAVGAALVVLGVGGLLREHREQRP